LLVLRRQPARRRQNTHSGRGDRRMRSGGGPGGAGVGSKARRHSPHLLVLGVGNLVYPCQVQHGMGLARRGKPIASITRAINNCEDKMIFFSTLLVPKSPARTVRHFSSRQDTPHILSFRGKRDHYLSQEREETKRVRPDHRWVEGVLSSAELSVGKKAPWKKRKGRTFDARQASR
jgi:hypothetical protein